MKPVKLPKEQRDVLIEEIREYFENERGESIGHLAADSMLEFFMARISPYIYNQALDDCRQLVTQRMVSLEEDIYALEQKAKRTR
ncbi:DUF2164 domain-containing protein [Paenibacillus sp. DMB20]|uniref:DUF2164 domain-containing protein n=1 Tax=Paenibacillus sp. DMB20 TaxID=1642570 RepID=UPI0006274E9C|nr:DUF2164 domain-containing protein [Paenibacillus sp. DMB20]KKO54725.1 hypothetical protein XI25_05395 [Paenibacillus sp. DMB20]